MFGRGRESEIDAGAAMERSEGARIAGERGASRLGSEGRSGIPGTRMFILLVVAVIVALMVAFTWKAWSLRATGDRKREVTVRQVIPSLATRPLPREPVQEPAPPSPAEVVAAAMAPQPPVRKTNAAPEKSLEERIRERMLKSKLNSGGVAAPVGSAPAADEPVTTAGILSRREKTGELSGKLEPLRLKGAAAGTIPDRDLFITQGTMIDCVLDTRMVTDQPGMTICHLTRDVYSASGRVVLLDRGSKVVGFYQGGLKQGQARIFVQWARVETPEGVVIELASPGTGPLGEAGVGGTIDNHFWERFGAAILISIVGDLGEFASSIGGKEGSGTSISFDNTSQGAQSAVSEVLKNTIDIPPTLSKNQGERVAILVARDLDFRGVYGLRAE